MHGGIRQWVVAAIWRFAAVASLITASNLELSIQSEASPQQLAQGPSWYYCDSTLAYYPNVASCDIPWRVVPATPSTTAPSPSRNASGTFDCTTYPQYVASQSNRDYRTSAAMDANYFFAKVENRPAEDIDKIVQIVNACYEYYTFTRRGPSLAAVSMDLDRLKVYLADAAKQTRLKNEQQQERVASKNSKLPMCDGDRTTDELREAIALGPAGKTIGLRLIDLRDAKERSFDLQNNARICDATAFFSNGKRAVTYSIEWVREDKGTYFIEVR
jgi:hypothetical protein